MNIAVILAGGIGERVGALDKKGKPIPKQFVEVQGKPLLVHTIEVFEKNVNIDAIEVVCIQEYVDYMKELTEKYSLKKVKWIVTGGDTFQRSVINGVMALRGMVQDEDIVLVHFGASPFVGDDIIEDAIRVCRKHGNAISTTDFFLLCGKKNSLDSVEREGNFSSIYINRDTVACMSTPHAFKYRYIFDLYTKAIKEEIVDRVEPHTTTLMYEMGEKIYFSKGSQTNIKITRKEDLDLFEGYLLLRQKRERERDKG